VQLLGPALFAIEPAEEQHQMRCEPLVFIEGRRLPGARLVEDRGRLRLRAEGGKSVVESVVGKAAAERVKEAVPLTQGVFETG
jgi:hypothetical protein